MNAFAAAQEYHPMSMSVFGFLLMRLKQVGYPVHWLSAAIEKLLKGSISTTARFPAHSPEIIPKQTPPQATLDISAYTMDLNITISLMLDDLGFSVSAEFYEANSIHYYEHDIFIYAGVNTMGKARNPSLGVFLCKNVQNKKKLMAELENFSSYKSIKQRVAAAKGNIQMLTMFKFCKLNRLGLYLPEKEIKSTSFVVLFRTDCWLVISQPHSLAEFKKN